MVAVPHARRHMRPPSPDREDTSNETLNRALCGQKQPASPTTSFTGGTFGDTTGAGFQLPYVQIGLFAGVA